MRLFSPNVKNRPSKSVESSCVSVFPSFCLFFSLFVCKRCRIFTKRKKIKEKWKKLLTNKGKYDRIYRLTAEAWGARKPDRTSRDKKTFKKPKKVLKKVLTRRSRCGIIGRSTRKRRAGEWSLKIEQQERSTKRKSLKRISEILTDENTTQTKVKEAKSKTRKQRDWITGRLVF